MDRKLTRAEEDIMLILWKLKEATVREVMKEVQPPDTPYTTISTMIRVLEKKGFVDHRAVGTTYLYYPVVSKKEYLRGFLTGVVKNYFNGSYSGLATFFARETDLKLSELQTIIEEIEGETYKKDPADE
jgi:predicted transcriptional regulator